ncbi:MAG: DMT family transporter [Micromonosporaceae bacterium]|nr:DMT family transporter [Micromonosporaceae bacterium]
MAAVIALGLLAALLFAGSAAMQQHGVRLTQPPPTATPWPTKPPHPAGLVAAVPVVRLAGRLARSRWWLAGTAANIAGTGVQATALHLGSVAVVQTVLVTQLLFALPLGSLWNRHWPRAIDWLASLAICGGLALFFSVPGAAPGGGTADRWRLVLAAGSAAILVALLLAMAARSGPLAGGGRLGVATRAAMVHTALVAVAAGVCFATSAVFIKVTLADILHIGLVGTATDWVGYGLAVAAVSGFIIDQEAYASGSLTAALAGTTITEPVTSYLLTVLVFRTGFPESGQSLAALLGAAALIATGVVGLAHSPSVRRATARVTQRRSRRQSPSRSLG